MIIKTLQTLGLAWDVQLPTQKQREAKRRKEGAPAPATPAASKATMKAVKLTATAAATKLE
jgi:hypothetical protein